MPDREKAIRILEGNYKSFVLRHNSELLTVNELIALLKAQEAVKPVWMGNDMRIGFYACGACGMNMGTNPNYCWYCGRKVKWE